MTFLEVVFIYELDLSFGRILSGQNDQPGTVAQYLSVFNEKLLKNNEKKEEKEEEEDQCNTIHSRSLL